MLKNYFKTAWRSLARNKAYSIINISGLAVGIACCVLITMYVRKELSYDSYHVNEKEIYRVLHAYRNGKDLKALPPPAPEEFQVWGNAPVAMAIAAEFPEVKKVVRFTSPNSLLLQYQEKRFQEGQILFIDSTAFDVFSWKMLAGDPKNALVAPNTIVLTESVARKYFGNSDPLGKVLKVEKDLSFTVSGVMEDVPSNSHFSFNGLISMSTFRNFRPEIFNQWGYVDFYTYFQVAAHTDINKLKARIPALLKHRYAENDGSYMMDFEPLTAAYLHSEATRQPGVTGSLKNVYIFSLIAVFILLIACINFMNLSTARSMERAKEVGVRKAIGANRNGLMYQFLTESVLISLVAVIIGVVLAILLLPLATSISGKPFAYGELISWRIAPLLAITALIVGVLAGSYPAWVLARFKPVEVLKGKFRSSGKGILLRKGLVVLQFSLSIALIAGTAIVFSQLEHLRSHDLGFRQDQVLILDYGGDDKVNERIEAVKAELSKVPNVLSASASRATPGDFFPDAYTTIEANKGEMQGFNPALYEIDYDFISVYQIKMAAGRAYSREFPADKEQTLIVNEAAAKLYGYANPEDIIGKRFDQWGRKGNIVGVVKDFNYESLHKKIEPLVLRMAPAPTLNKISLHLKADNLSGTIAALESKWASLAPQRPFLYSFMDKSFSMQYEEDQRFRNMFGAFAGLTIFIASLGLFGLATYATEQRIKEIGIRKVLGGSVGSIVRLLSSDFVKLVLIAILIATPAAWWGMNRWLEGFPYHINIQWWVFALSGLLAVVIALLTVSFQAVKAALMDPVKSLRAD